MSRAELKSLFPVPLLQVEEFLDPSLVADLLALARASAATRNSRSTGLSHADLSDRDVQTRLHDLGRRAEPLLQSFGRHLFGEALRWSVKEIWMNVLRHGGHQGVHAHANSFISGIIYLTRSHPSARTVFHKALGGREYTFSNHHAGTEIGPYNGDKWVAPVLAPGSMLLYPSYLLHEVPANQGEERITIAFNAVPDRLNSWGYELRFAHGARDA